MCFMQHVVKRATPTPTQTPLPGSETSPTSNEAIHPSSPSKTSQSQHSNADSSQSQSANINSSTPPQPPPPVPTSSSSSSSSLPPIQSQEVGTSLMVDQMQCSNDRRSFVLQDQFQKVVLKQCTSSRFQIRPAP